MGLFDKIFGNYSKKELAKIEPIKNRYSSLKVSMPICLTRSWADRLPF